MKNTLIIPVAAVAALLLSSSSPASAQPAYSECLMGWHSVSSTWGWVLDRRYTVAMLHHSRNDNNPDRLKASLDKLLVRAAATHTKADRCDPKVTDRRLGTIAKAKAKAEAKRARALAHAKNLHGHLAFAKEANRMRVSIRKSDGTRYDKLMAQARGFAGRAKAASRTNRQISPHWYQQIIRTLNADLDRERKRGAVLKAKADLKRLLEGAVTARMPAFKPDDSYDPVKVAEAFKTAPIDDFVYLRKGNSYYAPGPQNHYERTGNRAGIKTAAYVDYNERAVYPIYKVAPGPAGEFTPGLLWNTTDKNGVIFVAMDGGRYRTYTTRLVRGISDAKSWPTAPLHTVLLGRDIAFLGERGVLPAKLAKRLAKVGAKYLACSDRIWKSHARKFDRIRARNLLRHVRATRIRQLRGVVGRKIDRSCKRYRRTYKKSWAKSLTLYRVERQAVLDVARARLATAPAKAAEAKAK